MSIHQALGLSGNDKIALGVGTILAEKSHDYHFTDGTLRLGASMWGSSGLSCHSPQLGSVWARWRTLKENNHNALGLPLSEGWLSLVFRKSSEPYQGYTAIVPFFKNEGPKSAEGKANWASVESGPLVRPMLQPEPYSERVSTLPGNAEQMRAFTDGCVPAAVLHFAQRVLLHLQNNSMRWLPLKPAVYI